MSRIFSGSHGAQNGFVEVLHEHFIEFAERECRAIIHLHEAFDAEPRVGVLIAEHFGQRALMVEQQAILFAAGEHVQRVAHAPEKVAARA